MNWRGMFVLAVAMGTVCVSGKAQSMGAATASGPRIDVAGDGPFSIVKGQPYSLVEKTTEILTRADGATMTTYLEEHKIRDSEGRTRTESGTVEDGHFVLQNISIMDPVAGTMTTMWVNGRFAMVTHFTPPKSLTPEQEAREAEFRAKAEAYLGEHPAPPPGYEDLQPETIAGVYATGKRHTLIVHVGPKGNDRDIHVVEDTWTSPDLKISMRSTRDDPNMGKITREVTELDRNEPDPTLFQIPPNYKIIGHNQ